MLKDPRLINPQFGYDYQMGHPGFLPKKDHFGSSQRSMCCYVIVGDTV